MEPGRVITGLWLAFALSWLAAAWWSSSSSGRIGWKSELPYRLVLLVGGIVFAIPAHGYSGPFRLWRVNEFEAWTCVALIAAGFAFCWWARIELGRLWSGHVTKKTDHAVIETGPYGIVRHPIYTGILLAVFATATAKGTVLGIVGALIITVGLWMKARLEESWLRKELPTGTYDAYSRKVPMLLPFVPLG